MITVELDIFSGMPNPQWSLGSQDSQLLLQQIFDGVAPVVPLDSTGELGYRGFIIRASGAEADQLASNGLPASLRICRRVDPAAASPSAAMNTSAIAVDPLDENAEMIDVDPMLATAASTEVASCSLLYTSSSDFTFWNGGRKTWNNCYNYAANYASNTDLPGTAYDGRALPGRISGQPLMYLTPQDMTRALIADGWKTQCVGGNLRIECYIWPNYDFHFFRKNLNSSNQTRWCHKPGQTAATNRQYDSATQTWTGPVIPNIATANRAGYNQHVGTFFSGTGNRFVKVK